jgi:HK97 family phage prohead protease
MQTYEQRLAHWDAQLREKYTQDDRDKMATAGEAMADGTYPIADEDDLDNAIHAVGRGNADHDAIRKHIIARAKALSFSSKIPDNWNADGSLSDEEKAASWDAQHRDAGTTYGDTYDMLSSAIAAEFGDDKDDWTYLVDFSDEWAVYCLNSEKFQVLYSLDGSAVKLGKATPVREVTTYLPMESKSGAPEGEKVTVPAVPKRAFFSLTERPVPVEMRMDPGDDPTTATFVGYASTTGQGYAVNDWLGEYRETIMPGAFAKTLREQKDVPLLFNHDGIPLASTGSATSRLSEDGQGLRNEATLDRSDGQTNTICVQLKRGVLNKMSFSFRSVKDDWNDSYDERSVAELALYDTSIVTYPANPSTTAELRSEFREALGREGLGVMFSARAALVGYTETRTLEDAAEPVIEQAIRALAGADEILCRRSTGPYARSRTFLVAGLMDEVRAGKALSAKNEALLQSAVDALSGASKQHAKVAAAHQKAADAVGQVLNAGTNANDQSANANGTGANQGPPAGSNPISPTDGAGPRSVPASVLLAKRQLAELKIPRRAA